MSLGRTNVIYRDGPELSHANFRGSVLLSRGIASGS